jgi:SNF2 family DNA or RNA helicase
MPGLLGSHRSYQRRFVKPIQRDDDSNAKEELRRAVRPYILRRVKSEVLAELPPLTTVRHEVRLSRDEAVRYAMLRRQIHDKLHTGHGKRQNKLEILAEIMRLRRFCCHPRLVFPDASRDCSKVEAFLELVTELIDGGHRALVFSQFTDFLGLVREHLDERGIGYEYLDGSTPRHKRKESVDAFQTGNTPLFLISLKAGGFGLNLTAADYVIHLDPWWNPAVEAQATDRAHRIGQERPVTVYRLVTKETIEESILELHDDKRRLADALLEGADAVASDIDPEQLLALLGPRELQPG